MIKVKSIEEAWMKANELFPTDYIKDEQSTQNAGYPIYKSTAFGNGSWISDLGTSLELNIQKGKKIETVRIVIEEEPVSHHFEINVKAGYHVFTFMCSTAYEAYQAIEDAMITFKMDVDMDKMMQTLMDMKNGNTISSENKWFMIQWKEGEV